MSLLSYARAVPKAELHVHLEGTIAPATLLDMAACNGVELPPDVADELAHGVTFRDFSHFITLFRTACRCLRTPADYERAAYELGAQLARQNVRYAEVTFSPSAHHLNGVPMAAYLDGLGAARARVAADFGVELAWIFAIVRHWQDTSLIFPLTDQTLDAALAGRAAGVVALGLAGAEAATPPEPFAPWFERARAEGLHAVPHAGEHAGPESVRGAVRALGAERVAHGVRAVEDPALVAHLAAEGVPLDVCPLSNARLGVVERLADHPLPRLRAAGVTVTVNSDDPALFGTSLSDDYAALVEPLGLTADEIDAIALAGFGASFLPPERKQALVAEVRAELAALRREHLGGG